MNVGYIKVWRKIESWEWFQDPQTLGFFLYLMLKANHKDSRYMGYEVPRGSLVCGRKALSEQLGLSERTVRTLLTRLKATNEITIKTTSRFSVVSIVNYSKYQDKTTNETTNETTADRPASDQQPTTSKECKNERINNNGFSEAFESLWNQYPRREGKKQALKHFLTSVKTEEDLSSIKTAIRNYTTHVSTAGVEPRFIKMGSTFFNNWRDWVVPPVAPKSSGGLSCDQPFPAEYR